MWSINCVMLQGAGTKDSVLIEIFASRTNEQIRALNDVYLQGKEWKLCTNLYTYFYKYKHVLSPSRRIVPTGLCDEFFTLWFLACFGCFLHRRRKKADLWPKKGSFWGLFQSAAPPGWGLSCQYNQTQWTVYYIHLIKLQMIWRQREKRPVGTFMKTTKFLSSSRHVTYSRINFHFFFEVQFHLYHFFTRARGMRAPRSIQKRQKKTPRCSMRCV